MRLIDADKLIETIKEDIDRYYKLNLSLSIGTLKHMMKQVNEQPTVDAKPIVHTKWKNGGDAIYDTCTACNELIYLAFEMNYCPNCGAKLEAKDD